VAEAGAAAAKAAGGGARTAAAQRQAPAAAAKPKQRRQPATQKQLVSRKRKATGRVTTVRPCMSFQKHVMHHLIAVGY